MAGPNPPQPVLKLEIDHNPEVATVEELDAKHQFVLLPVAHKLEETYQTGTLPTLLKGGGAPLEYSVTSQTLLSSMTIAPNAFHLLQEQQSGCLATHHP